MTDSLNRISLIAAAAALALGLAACNKTDDRTVGQQVDAAVAKDNGDRTRVGQALQDLALPLDAQGDRYQGPATATFDSTLARVRVN